MKKKHISLLALLLALAMLASCFAACDSQEEITTEVPSESTVESSSESTQDETNSETQTSAASEGSETEIKTETETESETETETEVALEGPYADTISYANKIANGVQAYYVDAARNNYRVVNKNMTLDYSLSAATDQVVSSIKNTKGASYIENTMDVFLKMTDGNTYYASKSTASTRPNIYRLGYYYYDVHFLEQNFFGGAEIIAEKEFAAKYFSSGHDITGPKLKQNVVVYTVTGADPYVYMMNTTKNENFYFAAEEYNSLQFTLKTTKSTSGDLYFVAGSETGHNNNQRVSFKIIADGQWHTYTVRLSAVADYTGLVRALRFDVGAMNEVVELKDVKAVKTENNAPNILVDRTLHTYPDKMNQVLHFVSTNEVTGIEAMGMITEIAVDTVDKLVVKDANGLHESIDGVDWNTAEYIGFDIKNAGIFGYILLAHENSGKLEVALTDGKYVITQTSAPKDGKLLPPNAKETYTSNDFFMGQRVYTDENHTFDEFLLEAEYERNPMKSITGESYVGYDALRGAYKFTINGSGFNDPFFNNWNRHYTAEITAKGTDKDRSIYVYTLYKGGTGEGAAILDSNDMLLPLPVMIYKNFGGEDEEPVFNAGDKEYSETFFPLVIPAREKISLTVLNLYQNWGAMPLKQLSSIQYFWPYYHLSVGTTETSCISPWYGARDLWTLPDFRAISMPYWFELDGDDYSNQPQHTHGGYQYFLQYTDAEGKYYATENYNNDIDSSGPVYAEVTMDYISDESRIKTSFTHLEYAQTDELRAYYEIKYEVLEDIKIKDFKNDFSIYSFEGYAGQYRKMGYLDENNQIVHKETNQTKTPEYITLGDKSPYVALYDLFTTSKDWATNNVNLGFVIYNSDIVIGGEKCDQNFMIKGQNALYGLTMDLGEVTLKAGDYIKINMIISPWGWYTSTDDSNMQAIRENTCLDPLLCTVVNGEKIASPFLPRIKSTDGKSAEFTLTGGSNNVAVRVYGFKTLTAPKIYEKIGGEWKEYVISSINNPDKSDNKHYYDGYSVYYDGDGTYSYAFGVNMDDVESRTFKIEVDGKFEPWPVIEVVENEDPINVYVNAEKLKDRAIAGSGCGEIEVAEDKSYASFHGNGEAAEAYFSAFTSDTDSPTGQYLIVKYRIPKKVTETCQFQIFTSTVNTSAVPAENFYLSPLSKDGEWHIIVADLTKQGLPTFTPEENGKYFAKYLRLDIFNAKMSTESYIDLAYIGLSDNLDDICTLNGNEGTAVMSEKGQTVATLDLSTGEIVASSGTEEETPTTTTPKIPEVLVDPASGFTKSTTPYLSCIDFINGKGDEVEGDPQYNNKGGNHAKGAELFVYDGPTAGESILAFAGWTMVYEGIKTYMWSADDGKTWQECIVYGRESIGDASPGIIGVAQNTFKSVNADYDASKYAYKSGYQCNAGSISGIACKLNAYVGQEINVVFAVVPENAPETLCPIAYVTNVRVYASDEDAYKGEACKHESVDKFVFVDDGDDATEQAKLQGKCKCGEVEFDVVDPNYVFFFSSLGTQSNVAPLVMERSKGYVKEDATTLKVRDADKAFTADADGNLKIVGWAGCSGGIADIVFKVLDSNGNEMTNGWQTSNPTFKNNQSDLNSEMTKRDIATKYGVRYDLTIDLSTYHASNEKVTVALAFVVSDIPEGCNDKYIYLGEFANVAKAS